MEGTEYWEKEVAYQLDEMEVKLPEKKKQEIAKKVAEQFIEDELIWERINETIGDLIEQELEE